jgi:hypothetical protein
MAKPYQKASMAVPDELDLPPLASAGIHGSPDELIIILVATVYKLPGQSSQVS